MIVSPHHRLTLPPFHRASLAQVITAVVSYTCFLIFPASLNRYLVPLFAISYCIVGHVHRQYINYMGWDLDFTGAQMVVTIKLYSMAWNLYDGELIKKGGDLPRATQKCSKFAIDGCPDLLEFLGYIFCFSNVLAGPAFEFKTYQNAANGTLMYNADGTPRGKIPSRLKHVFVPLLCSVLSLAFFLVVTSQLPIMDPEGEGAGGQVERSDDTDCESRALTGRDPQQYL